MEKVLSTRHGIRIVLIKSKQFTMAKRPTFPVLRNPPIVEATFQVNFAVKTPMGAEEAKEFVKRKFPGYLFKGTLFTESISVKKKAPIAPPAEIIHEQNWMGAHFAEGNRILTLLPNGYAFGVLQPYPTDESFFKNIQEVGEAFASRYSGVPVARMGFRFINRFDESPLSPADLLRTLPSSPARLGYGAPVKFFYQDVFRDADKGIVLVVNRLYPANQKQNTLLDIDASLMPNKILDSEAFERAMIDLRHAANKAFFGSVKPPILEKFK